MSPLKTRPPLSIAQFAAKQFGMLYSRISYGDKCASFNEEMVRVLGAKGFMTWAGTGGGAQTNLTKKYGSFSAQLLTGVVAMLNGCTYCGKGHFLAANLHFYKDRGELFDIDEAHVYWLQRCKDVEVRDIILKALDGAGLEKERQLVSRLLEIKMGTGGEPTDDDPWLAAINGAWDWATECSITLEIIDVPALDGVGKNRELVKRYRQARDDWRKDNASHPAAGVDQPWQKTG